MFDQILQYGAQIGLTGGVAASVAYWVFRTYSSKWLETKFAKGLADYKHAQAKEMEDVRFKIQSTFDRLTKLHQKEFEILPQVWLKLNDAYWKTSICVASFRSYPDLSRMGKDELIEFVNSCELAEWQKKEILGAEDMNKCYINHINRHRLYIAEKASRECHIYLETNGIFLKIDMKEQFKRIDDCIWNALADYRYFLRPDRGNSVAPGRDKNIDILEKQGKALMQELEEKVRGRLHE